MTGNDLLEFLLAQSDEVLDHELVARDLDFRYAPTTVELLGGHVTINLEPPAGKTPPRRPTQ